MIGDALWDATVGRLLSGLANAIVDMFTLAMTWWLRPDLDPVDLGAGAIDGVGGITKTIGLVILVFGLVAAGIRLAWRRDGSDLVDVVATVFRFLVVITAGWTLIALLVRLSNQLTDWIMPSADTTLITDPSMSWYIATLPAAVGILSSAVPLVGVLLAVLFVGSTCAMFITVLFRTASIIVLMVVLPIAAAGGATVTTRAWFPKVAGWLLALIFWRPVAALIYRVAAEIPEREAVDTPSALQLLLIALTMMLLAIAALPAMMRLLSFATGGLGAGGGGVSAAVVGGSIAGGMMLRRVGESGITQASAPAAGAATAASSSMPAATGEPVSTAALATLHATRQVIDTAQGVVRSGADDATPPPDGGEPSGGPR